MLRQTIFVLKDFGAKVTDLCVQHVMQISNMHIKQGVGQKSTKSKLLTSKVTRVMALFLMKSHTHFLSHLSQANFLSASVLCRSRTWLSSLALVKKRFEHCLHSNLRKSFGPCIDRMWYFNPDFLPYVRWQWSHLQNTDFTDHLSLYRICYQ